MKIDILAIFAHPDDEAYGPGGTLAKYARGGYKVGLITLTRGEAGSMGICKTLPPEEVARMRTEELKCAAKELNLAYLRMYSLPDKALENYPAEEGIRIVKTEMLALKPTVVITFHDKGISGHPDHIAVAQWTREAVKQLDSRPRLFFYGVSPSQAEKIKPYRSVIPFENGEITHIIQTQDFFPYKLAAIRCHASQIELWEKFQQIEGGYEYFARQEHFSQIYPPLSVSQPYSDLLESPE